jgi:hypothetical protein
VCTFVPINGGNASVAGLPLGVYHDAAGAESARATGEGLYMYCYFGFRHNIGPESLQRIEYVRIEKMPAAAVHRHMKHIVDIEKIAYHC